MNVAAMAVITLFIFAESLSRTVGWDLLSSIQIGGLEAISISLASGAGGRDALPGDYLYGDHREPFREAGLWGLFRVYPQGADVPLLPL